MIQLYIRKNEKPWGDGGKRRPRWEIRENRPSAPVIDAGAANTIEEARGAGAARFAELIAGLPVGSITFRQSPAPPRQSSIRPDNDDPGPSASEHFLGSRVIVRQARQQAYHARVKHLIDSHPETGFEVKRETDRTSHRQGIMQAFEYGRLPQFKRGALITTALPRAEHQLAAMKLGVAIYVIAED